jgi:hypothetical protein
VWFLSFTATGVPQEQLTNESILKMVKAGVSDEIIIGAVQRHPGNYNLSPDELISLKAGGVPDKVVAAMLDKASTPAAEGARTAPTPARGPLLPGTYRVIQVMQFEKQPAVNMPAEAVAGLTGDVVSALREKLQSAKVLSDGEQTDPNQPAIKVAGTIVQFKKGSRLTRYMVGPAALAGPGKSVVKARIRLIDNGTGEVLHEQDVDGRVWIGFFGGSSEGAKEGLAKEIAKVVSKKFF